MNKYSYEVKQIDAWMGPDNQWYWNDAYNLGILTTAAVTKQGLKKALVMYLCNHARILVNLRKTRCDYYGDILEIHDRSTDEPLFAVIPLF